MLVYLCWKVQGVESSVRSKENPGVLEVPDWLLTLRARLPTVPRCVVLMMINMSLLNAPHPRKSLVRGGV